MQEIWQAIRKLCEPIGEIGELPQEVVNATEYGPAEEIGPIPVSPQSLQEALAFWRGAMKEGPFWLHSRFLGRVVQHLGFFAGKRLGLQDTAALAFGDWLGLAVAGYYESHANEYAVAGLDQIAGKAACGDQSTVGRAYLSAEFWTRYQPGVRLSSKPSGMAFWMWNGAKIDQSEANIRRNEEVQFWTELPNKPA